MFCVWRRTIGLIERISSEYTRSGVSICGVFIYSMHAVIFARVSTKQCTMQSSAHTLRRTIPQSLHHVYMQFLKLPLLNMWNLFATIAGFSLSAAYHDWPLERGIEKERKIEQKKKDLPIQAIDAETTLSWIHSWATKCLSHCSKWTNRMIHDEKSANLSIILCLNQNDGGILSH